MTGRERPAAIRTIPAGVPFADALAAGLLDQAGDDLALARTVVLLPTRRACRALSDAFLRLSEGRPLLLPRMWPLGDVEEDRLLAAGGLGGAGDELPPAISPLRRLLLLTRLVLAAGSRFGSGRPPSHDQAARLAAALGELLDSVQTERLTFDGLVDLGGDFAEHWQVTLDFLRIVTESWPAVLKDEGSIDPAERRNRLIARQCAAWRDSPPDHPVVAAGSTGSVPATAELLDVVARLPQGCVVLPGLDRSERAEAEGGLPETHPQAGMRRLLAALEVAPADVADWSPETVRRARLPVTAQARAHLIGEALRPAETTGAWRATGLNVKGAMEGVARIDCPSPREEAAVIALAMREALENPEQTCALVTPDRSLARRVAAELKRFGIEADDSAGRPLSDTPPGVFLRLAAHAAAERFAPVPLLALLKHPLASGGDAPGTFRSRVRAMECAILRGPRPGPGLEGLRVALDTARAPAFLRPWLEEIVAAAAPLEAAMAQPVARLPDLLRAHVAFTERLAVDDTGSGPARLWAGEAGEAANGFVADLLDSADGLPPLAGRHYPALLQALLQDATVRPHHERHPRLFIWGALEARLQRADVMILGGLNEATWPPEVEADPWMSRQMRARFGLPPVERRVGLSAHDFVQAFCARRVLLTRSTRVEGTPTVPSRWLLRLEALLQAQGQGFDTADAGRMLRWQAALDEPGAFAPVPPPEPRPPVAVRPRRMSVTGIERWMRDPYAVFARDILRLKPLDPVDRQPEAADYGSLIHRALDRFVRQHPEALPADADTRLLAIGREAFEPMQGMPGVMAFWWPRFERIARWFVAQERLRRTAIAAIAAEVEGSLELPAAAGPFRLTAKADRVDTLRNGGISIVDYKTGQPPSQRDVAAGFSPQLPLEALIAKKGGFVDVPMAEVEALAFWRLGGGDPPGEDCPVKPPRGSADPAYIERLVTEAQAGLAALVAAFDDPATPYLCQPRPDKAPRYGDYDHLARVPEWSAAAGDGE
ncbi:MAG: double-strand break repair protein AddB [Acetobacterales bacterium]